MNIVQTDLSWKRPIAQRSRNVISSDAYHVCCQLNKDGLQQSHHVESSPRFLAKARYSSLDLWFALVLEFVTVFEDLERQVCFAANLSGMTCTNEAG